MPKRNRARHYESRGLIIDANSAGRDYRTGDIMLAIGSAIIALIAWGWL